MVNSKASQDSTCQTPQSQAANMEQQDRLREDLQQEQEPDEQQILSPETGGEEDGQDEVEMLETMNMMAFVSLQIEKEDDQKRAEEAEMSETIQLLNQVVLSENDERRVARGVFDDLQRQVRFYGKVKVAYLPLEESKVARMARKRYWGPGPLHDELWDGDLNTFRETELSPEQLAVINRRKTKVDKLRTFFRLKDAKIDVRAHAKRSITDETDEEEFMNEKLEKQDEDSMSLTISSKSSSDQMDKTGSKIEKRRSTLKLVTSYIRSSVNPTSFKSKSKRASLESKTEQQFYPIIVLNECASLKGELENRNPYDDDSDEEEEEELNNDFGGGGGDEQQKDLSANGDDTGKNLWVNQQPTALIES